MELHIADACFRIQLRGLLLNVSPRWPSNREVWVQQLRQLSLRRALHHIWACWKHSSCRHLRPNVQIQAAFHADSHFDYEQSVDSDHLTRNRQQIRHFCGNGLLRPLPDPCDWSWLLLCCRKLSAYLSCCILRNCSYCKCSSRHSHHFCCFGVCQ